MACSPSGISIENEAESEDFVIIIPPDLPPAEWPECCIYRVPMKLRKVNEDAYTPKLVSIGPFHHGRKELGDIEMHKLRYFRDFWERTSKTSKCLKDLQKIIEVNEEKIRHCYSEEFRHISSIDFVKMILLDAIFIIELFLKTKEEEKEDYSQKKEKEDSQKKEKEDSQKKEKDYILRKPLLRNGILHDLILLENQLPFFVLKKLYERACNDKDISFLDLFCNYFSHYKWAKNSFESEKVKHFTDLVRLLYCPPNVGDWSRVEGRPDTRFCATKLDDAGFNFKGVEDHSKALLDITLPTCLRKHWCRTCLCFVCCFPCICCLSILCCRSMNHLLHASLEVPQLVIDYDTEVIFRNLMALEQCHYPSEAYICSYVWLLDRLIDTEKDVDLLVKKKVIANNLGNNAAVATLINELGNQIVATTSSYDDIARKLNGRYEDRWIHSLATLKREYFPNIFRGTATIVGLIVLGLTFLSFLQ